MTNNLKIEVLVSNIPEDGSIASQFPSQEYVDQQLAKKANLSPEGRLDPSHAPDYTEIPGLYEHIEDTKDEIGLSIASSLQDAKGYTNQQLSTSLQTKADLVNGKIPFDQIPFSADIEDQIQINVENITAVVDQKVAQVVEQVNQASTAANAYTDTKVAENKAYIDNTIGNVIEDVERLGVSKAVTIPTYLTPEAGVAAGTGVAAGAYYNVRSTEDDAVAIEYQNVGGVPTPTGKSFPSSELLSQALVDVAEIKTAIIDPESNKPSAAKVFDDNGNSLQDISKETIYVDFVLPGVKLAGDWNGTTGTDDTEKLQQIINSFGVKRVNLLFSEKRYRLDSARIDFKRVNLIGKGTTDNGATGGTEFYIGDLGGLYSSIQDNTAPRQENIRITSASTRSQNGQTALDLTGLNYPNMENVTIYGAEKPLVLSGGTVVECHYGRFTNVNISRGYHGVTVAGGNRTQTHNFFGGRFWDCVVGVKNRGTSDINFHGTAFESDQAFINSTEDGDVPETNIFGMRDECNLAPDNAPQGSTLTYTGVYWSGWKKPREFSVDDSGEVKEHGKVMTANVRGDMSVLGHNLLRNPEMKPDLATSRPVGWTFPSGATDVAEVSLPRGRGWKWTRGAVFQAFEQNGINLKKGRYVIGFTLDKFNQSSIGNIIMQLTDSTGALLVAGVDVSVDFSAVNFTNISGGYRGSQVVKEIFVLRDLTNVRFRAGINNMPVGQVGFFGQPFIVKGANFDKYYNANEYPEGVQYSTAAPTSVSHRAGQIVVNPYPTSTNPVTEWIADTTTTWKPVKWVINSFATASLPVLTAAYRGVEAFDATTNTFKRWSGTAWI